MYNISTRTTSILLVFGVFFTLSCATFSTTSKNAESLYNNSNYSEALKAVNSELSDEPENNQKKVLKANILKDYAMNNREPSEREVLYSNLRNTVDEIQFSTDQFTSETDNILTSAWTHEQGEGVRYLQQDETENFDRFFNRIISHFQNAIAIIPDSLVTYNLMATTYYRHGELGKAITTLESIEEKGYTRQPDTSEKLAYLYLEAGMIDRSISVYEQLTANHSQNDAYREGLANAYILGEMHHKSIELLTKLAEEYPNRAEYREALATERFYQLQNEADELSRSSLLPLGEVETYVESLQEIATIYKEVDSLLPSSEERQQRIAEFHIGAATLLKNITRNSDSDSEVQQHAEEESQSHLQNAVPYLRSLYESNADNVAYARRLIRVYNDLGMENEAESLERQINF